MGTRETLFDNLVHTARHVQSYLPYYFTLMSRVMFEYQLDDIGRLRAFKQANNSAFQAFTSVIGDNGIQFTIGKGRFINTQVWSQVFRIYDILLGIRTLLPAMIVTYLIFVLALKVAPINTQIGFQNLAADGISVD